MHDLTQKEEIRNVLVRYAEACDKREWSLFDEVFDENVIVDYGGGFQLSGRESVVELIRSMLGGCGPTQHLLGNFKININGAAATSECYVRAAHAGLGGKENLLYEVWAEYRDELALVNGRWSITKRVMAVHKEVGTREVLGPQ